MHTLRMPAEWEPHDALWLAMPHDEEEWGAYFQGARQTLRSMVRELAADPGGDATQLLVTEIDPQLEGAQQHIAEYGDIWLRDTGPIFLHASGKELVAAGFAFNGWGDKYDFPGDKKVAAAIARIAGVELHRHALVAEGGSLDCNGAGTFLSTRECLLNSNRNPGMSESQVEAALATALGCQKLIWIDRGLRGDHTDGHIDNLARFVSKTEVFCMSPSGASDPNKDILEEIQAALRAARTAEGEPLQIIAVPSPGALEGPSGLMAASYCNFLITNRCVLAPVFDRAADSEALATLGNLFPDRRIVPIEAYALLTGGGTVHCISQQQPSRPRSGAPGAEAALSKDPVSR